MQWVCFTTFELLSSRRKNSELVGAVKVGIPHLDRTPIEKVGLELRCRPSLQNSQEFSFTGEQPTLILNDISMLYIMNISSSHFRCLSLLERITSGVSHSRTVYNVRYSYGTERSRKGARFRP